MKFLLPVLIALIGLGAGVGAGLALKPAPEAPEDAALACAEPPCADVAEAPDPFAPVAMTRQKPEGELVIVAMDKPFVVPVFEGERVRAMIVISLAIEIRAEDETQVQALQPRLRDALLGVMFRHANSGGFDGTFTEGRRMDDLRSGLFAAATEVLGTAALGEVLITEIARQDV
jgi:flagellar protein FliL